MGREEGRCCIEVVARWRWPRVHGRKMEVEVVVAPRKESYQEMQKAKHSKIARFFTKYDEVMR